MAYYSEFERLPFGSTGFAEPPAQTSTTIGVVSGFAFDSDRLGPPQHAALIEIARRLLAGTAAQFRIVGHTDTVGTVAYNAALGQRRAAAVQRALLATLERMQPLSSRRFRFTVESAGASSQRVAPDRGPTGGANRRVEILAPAVSRPAPSPAPRPTPIPRPVPPPEPSRGPTIGPATEPSVESRWCLGGQIACATLDFLRRQGGRYRLVSAEDRERAVQIELRALTDSGIPPLHPTRRQEWIHSLRRRAEERVADAIAGIIRR